MLLTAEKMINRTEKRLRVALEEALADRERLQGEIDELRQQLEEKVIENERLKAELNELKQAPFKRPRKRKNTEQNDTEGKRNKGGRPEGHTGSGRKRPQQVDHTERIEVGDACPDCGKAFTGKVIERERTIEDIEPVRPTIVTRYTIERRWCSCCQEYKEAPVSAALPNCRLGLNVMLFVVYQKVAMGLSYGKVRRELSMYFGLQVSKAQLIWMVAEVARLFGPAYARLIRLMREQASIHVDETGWRIDGDNHWLWVFVNDVVALYVISRSRGSKVPKALLGTDFKGVVISDFFSAYSPLDYEKAKCWAHLLADSHDLTKGKPPPDSERVRFHRQLHHIFIDMGLALEEVAADPNGRQRVSIEMKDKLLSFANSHWDDPDCQRLAQRILKYLDELLVWLHNPAVSPDNNTAERALRPAVITRKTSFGSRSKAGAHSFARLLSIIQTWHLQDKDFFSSARSAIIASQN